MVDLSKGISIIIFGRIDINASQNQALIMQSQVTNITMDE